MTETEQALSNYLQQFLTPERKARFAEVLEDRIGWLRIVVQDMYLDHNASAIMRSCDALGVQHMHAVETFNKFAASAEIALGSEKWVTLHRHLGENSTQQCLNELRSQGFAVAACVLRPHTLNLQSLPLDRPVALVLGNEKYGVSQEFLDGADYLVHMPMYGFVESFNVSVAAALALQTLTERIRSSSINWGLDDLEKAELKLKWARETVPNIQAIEKRFLADL